MKRNLWLRGPFVVVLHLLFMCELQFSCDSLSLFLIFQVVSLMAVYSWSESWIWCGFLTMISLGSRYILCFSWDLVGFVFKLEWWLNELIQRIASSERKCLIFHGWNYLITSLFIEENWFIYLRYLFYRRVIKKLAWNLPITFSNI